MRFLLTREVGKLATWLRILGFDALYSREEKRGAVIIQALRDDRVILTRNRRLPHSGGVRIVVLKSEQVKDQLVEAVAQLDIAPPAGGAFSRCVMCNVLLQPIDKEAVRSRVPDYVLRTQKEFFICPACRRIYWHGTHWESVQKVVKALWSS